MRSGLSEMHEQSEGLTREVEAYVARIAELEQVLEAAKQAADTQQHA